MSKRLEIIQTEKFDVMLQVLLKLMGDPDGVTISEMVADGIDIHNSTLEKMEKLGYIAADKTGKVVKWKLHSADGSSN